MAESDDKLQPHDELKTVKLDTAQISKLDAEEKKRRELKAAAPQTVEIKRSDYVHDGRFGERFDDELNVESIVWVTASIAIVTLVFFVLSWFLYRWLIGAEQAATPPPIPVVAAQDDARRLPTGPRLQPSPEHELIEMRREIGERLHGYGWVDEGAGIVHIPIDRAIDLVLENGLPSAGRGEPETAEPEAAEPEAAEPEAASEEGDAP